MQVARPKRPFAQKLDVPGITDLPFELEHYSDDPPLPEASQWAAFMDLARPLLEKGFTPEERMPPYLIGRKKGNRFVVATGTDNGGQLVIVRQTPTGFKLEHENFWSGSPWGDFPE